MIQTASGTSGPSAEGPNRVFLDATVLYAAARGGGVQKLWTIEQVELVTSEYAAHELWRNLADEPDAPGCRDRLADLLSAVWMARHDASPSTVVMDAIPDPADWPIMQAAIDLRCAYLLTSDKHFAQFWGRRLGGVVVLRPGHYLAIVEGRADRLD